MFGCEKPRTVFSLPKDGPNRGKWLEFIRDRPQQTGQLLFVCDGHFTDECLVNLGLYKSGLSARLTLKTGAIPTIKPSEGEQGANTSHEPSAHTEHSGCQQGTVPSVTPKVKSCGVQTCPTSVLSKSVSTQLSEGTLKVHHVRSKGVQVNSASIDLCTKRQQHWHHLSSTRMKALASRVDQRPSKRPRLDGEEEGNIEDMDILDTPYNDSAHEPWTSATDGSELNEMEPANLEDKYIVFESSLKQLFDICPVCMRRCVVRRRKCGTFVSFTQECPRCLYSRKWQSGPVLGCTPIGNLQLSAAVYFSMESFSKIKKICKAMKLQIHHHNAFKRHCRLFLEPAVYHKWREDQTLLLDELKKKKGKIAVSGDVTTDSPDISRKIQKLSKAKVCREIKKCSAAIKNHVPQASSSKSVSEKVSNMLCAHSKKSPRDQCATALNKVKKALLSKKMLGDVANISSDQTSVETLQRVILHFAPKKKVFRDVGSLCRLYLAEMHHNENAKQATSKGKALFKVTCAKSKKGPVTAKPAESKTTFDYVAELMQIVFSEVFPDPSKFMEQLRMVPEPV